MLRFKERHTSLNLPLLFVGIKSRADGKAFRPGKWVET